MPVRLINKAKIINSPLRLETVPTSLLCWVSEFACKLTYRQHGGSSLSSEPAKTRLVKELTTKPDDLTTYICPLTSVCPCARVPVACMSPPPHKLKTSNFTAINSGKHLFQNQHALVDSVHTAQVFIVKPRTFYVTQKKMRDGSKGRMKPVAAGADQHRKPRTQEDAGHRML